MSTVGILEAQSSLARLVMALETGVESEILITRNGRLVARLLPAILPRIGVAKADFDIPPDDPEIDAIIADMFTGQKAGM